MKLPILLCLALIVIGWLGLLLWVGRTGKPAHEDGTSYTLRHSALLRWFAITALFGGGSLLILEMLIFPFDDVATYWLLVTAAILLGILGIALLLESYIWRLMVTPTTLDCRSPWKGRRVVNRTDIQSVKYSAMNGWYVIRFATGSFRVPAVVPGVKRFVSEFASTASSPPF